MLSCFSGKFHASAINNVSGMAAYLVEVSATEFNVSAPPAFSKKTRSPVTGQVSTWANRPRISFINPGDFNIFYPQHFSVYGYAGSGRTSRRKTIIHAFAAAVFAPNGAFFSSLAGFRCGRLKRELERKSPFLKGCISAVGADDLTGNQIRGG